MSIHHSGPEGPETPALERQLAGHVARTRFEDLSPATVEAARRTVIWHIATAMAGSAAPGSDAILRVARAQGGAPEASVFGAPVTLSATAAAFANASFGKAHEYEDKFWIDASGGFAIGYSVVPAALAAGEGAGISGRDLLAAVAVAVDLQARMVVAVTDNLASATTGFNSTYTFANLGSAVAAGKALGLDASGVVDALGLAHAQVCGNFQGQLEGVMGIRMQAGFVTRNGVTAALLAREGIGGLRQAFSGRYGLYALYYPGKKLDMAALTEGLGQNWLGDRLGYKGYPCGVVAHPVLDAIRELRGQVAAEEVARITVTGTPRLRIMADPLDRKQNPQNGIEAQFSLPWVVACTLRDGMLRLDHFDDARVADPDYLRLSRLVEVVKDAGREDVEVTLTTRDGREIRSAPVRFCRGHPDNPVTQAEMEDFLRQAAGICAVPVPPARVERLIGLLNDLERLDDIRALGASLRE